MSGVNVLSAAKRFVSGTQAISRVAAFDFLTDLFSVPSQ